MAEKILLGLDEMGQDVLFDPAAQHSILCGRTRSGKSVGAYRLLAQVAATPWVKLCGIDPTGILLGPAAEGKPSDFALGTSPEQLDRAIEVLHNIERLMDQRIERLMKLGLDKVPEQVYTDPRVGAVLLVLEEYAGTLSAGDRKQSEETRRVVGRVLREGAKAAIHCFTILQRPEASVLHDRAQYARSIVWSVENADTVRMVLPMAQPEHVERLLNAQPGRGYYAEAGEPLRFFRADLVEYEDYAPIVRERAVRKEPLFPVALKARAS